MSTTATASEVTRSTGPTLDLLPVVAACCTPAATVADDAAAGELARVFKALGDPARVKILSMLLNSDEVCACDVSAGIGKSAATTSHHLKQLREVGLVTGEKRGTWVWYRIVPERLTAVQNALAVAG